MVLDLTFGAFTVYQTFRVWQQITRGEQKDSMMNLHYSHSQGHFESLKSKARKQTQSYASTRILVFNQITITETPVSQQLEAAVRFHLFYLG